LEITIIGFALLCLLTGCAATYTWYHPKVEAWVIYRDNMACEAYGRQIGLDAIKASEADYYADRIAIRDNAESAAYQDCMRSNDYSLIPAD
jgi:hypothetical protein